MLPVMFFMALRLVDCCLFTPAAATAVITVAVATTTTITTAIATTAANVVNNIFLTKILPSTRNVPTNVVGVKNPHAHETWVGVLGYG